DREHEPRDPREPHSPASGERRRALRTGAALRSHSQRAGWLRRLHRRSMGTKADRRARGRAFSEDSRSVPRGILPTVIGLFDVDSRDVRLGAPSLAALLRAVTAAAGAASASDALRALAEAAQALSGAEIALVRALDDGGEQLEAVAVAAPPALAAELYGTVLPAAQLPEAPLDDLSRAPAAVRRVAEQTGATRLLL